MILCDFGMSKGFDWLVLQKKVLSHLVFDLEF